MEKVIINKIVSPAREYVAETFGFTPNEAYPYTMLQLTGNGTSGVVCFGFCGNSLWVGRVAGRFTIPHLIWRLLRTIAIRGECSEIVGADDNPTNHGRRLYDAFRFGTRQPGKLWEVERVYTCPVPPQRPTLTPKTVVM